MWFIIGISNSKWEEAQNNNHTSNFAMFPEALAGWVHNLQHFEKPSSHISFWEGFLETDE